MEANTNIENQNHNKQHLRLLLQVGTPSRTNVQRKPIEMKTEEKNYTNLVFLLHQSKNTIWSRGRMGENDSKFQKIAKSESQGEMREISSCQKKVFCWKEEKNALEKHAKTYLKRLQEAMPTPKV